MRELRKGGLQTWHGHLAREKRAISDEMLREITGKMPGTCLAQNNRSILDLRCFLEGGGTTPLCF
jgi:hypothetical protein